VAAVFHVFDGKRPVAKFGTNQARLERRLKSLAQVEGLLTDDATAVEIDNKKLLKTAASVSPELVMAVIERLRKEGLSYIVSPYESDGQLKFLSRMGIADAVNTADSDLIVLGCKEVITGVEGKERANGAILIATQIFFFTWTMTKRTRKQRIL